MDGHNGCGLLTTAAWACRYGRRWAMTKCSSPFKVGWSCVHSTARQRAHTARIYVCVQKKLTHKMPPELAHSMRPRSRGLGPASTHPPRHQPPTPLSMRLRTPSCRKGADNDATSLLTYIPKYHIDRFMGLLHSPMITTVILCPRIQLFFEFISLLYINVQACSRIHIVSTMRII